MKKREKKESQSDTSLQLDVNIWGAFCSPEEKRSLCCNDALYNVHLKRLQLKKCDFIAEFI